MSSDKTFIEINTSARSATGAVSILEQHEGSGTLVYPARVVASVFTNVVPTPNIELGIMPPVVRALSPKHDDFIFERPPHMHERPDGSSLAMPWTVFRIIFDQITQIEDDGVYEFRISEKSTMYWECSPAVTKTHRLIRCRFPWVKADGSFLNVLDTDIYRAVDCGTALKKVMSDALDKCSASKQLDDDSIIPGWTKMGLADIIGLFAENNVAGEDVESVLHWSPITIEDLIEDMRSRYSKSNEWIETSSLPFTHLLKMGTEGVKPIINTESTSAQTEEGQADDATAPG